MRAALELIEKLRGLGVELYVEKGKLYFRASANSLTKDIKQEISSNKGALIECLMEVQKRRKANKQKRSGLKKADREGHFPLSHAQQRLWFVDQLGESSAQYNIPGSFRLQGALDLSAFKRALSTLIERHEVLRTHFRVVDGEPRQVITTEYELPYYYDDLTGLSKFEQEAMVKRLSGEEAEKAFDLSRDLMLRVQLLKLSPDDHIVLYTMHHIASDGWSMGILQREFSALYQAYSEGRKNPLAPLSIQYADYAVWQREWLQGEVLEEQLRYWKTQLEGIPPVHSLPLDKPRPAVQSFSGKSHHQVIDKETTEKIRKLCEEHDVTLFMFLQTAFSVLLSRYSQQTDIVMGTAIAGRTHRDVEPLIGLFVNSLALRTDLSGNPHFSDLLKTSRAMILDAYEHQHIPFETLVEKLRPERSLAYSPLFQISFILRNFKNGEFELSESATAGSHRKIQEDSDGRQASIRVELEVRVSEVNESLRIHWLFNTKLFYPGTIIHLSSAYQNLLNSIIEGLTNGKDSKERINELNVLCQRDRHILLYEWNDTADPSRNEQCIHELFETQARKAPNAVALVYRDQQLTYAALNARANQLAHYLVAKGVTPDTLVGLCVERSLEMIIGLLGILKAGGAYVPLDPDYPPGRLEYMLKDSGIEVVVCQVGIVERWADEPRIIVYLDTAEDNAGQPFFGYPITNISPAAITLSPSHLAYVIYTSGSTGRPKGILVPHAAIYHSTTSRNNIYGFSVERFLLLSSIAFDSAAAGIYWTLCFGGCLYLPGQEKHFDLTQINQLIYNSKITHLLCLPSLWRQMLALIHLESLQSVIVAGEKCPIELARKHHQVAPNTKIYNEYGPSEATVWSTVYHIQDGVLSSTVPIGNPITNTKCYVLDAEGKLAPLGCVGELYIGGAGVVRGYLNSPSSTQKAFTADPFSCGEEFLYRTGDLVRWQSDGEMEFVGRIDDQVKIRGFRIELGEIESHLLKQTGVECAAVTTCEVDDGDQQLVAYIVLGELWVEKSSRRGVESDKQYQTKLLMRYKSELRKVLPGYMIPSLYVFLDKLPVTPNGKLDKGALPAPSEGDLEKSVYVAPRNDLEKMLCDTWKKVLRLEKISIHDNFFSLGGHSLKAIEITNKLQQYLGQTVHVVSMFDAPTVAKLATYLNEHYKDALHDKNLIEAEKDSVSRHEVVTEEHIEKLRSSVPPLQPYLSNREDKNPAAVFVLSPPRSGSTLLRVMLAGHSRLFSPPELELLGFNTLMERERYYIGQGDQFSLEGTIRLLMEVFDCGVDTAKRLMDEYVNQGVSARGFYNIVQKNLKGKLLVEKSASYGMNIEILKRAEMYFDSPRYIHLVRHPAAVVNSAKKVKLENVFFRQEHGLETQQLYESIWALSHANIIEFFKNIPEERRHQIKFEELVASPDIEAKRICEFLKIEFEHSLLEPYDKTQNRMTDGIYRVSKMFGDNKFHQYHKIEKQTASDWKKEAKEISLGAPTIKLARVFGYTEGLPKKDRYLPNLSRVSREHAPLLSYAQQRLWFIDQLGEGSAQYNMPGSFRLQGALELSAFKRALSSVIERHEVLRTHFAVVEGEPRQVITTDYELPFNYQDLSGLSELEQEATVKRLSGEEAEKAFDLSRDLMLRVQLLKLSPDDHIVLYTMHHIASDGWSMGILQREFSALYQAYSDGRENPLAPLSVQYADYAVWQREWLQGEVLEEQLRYWMTQLSGFPPVHSLPLDKPRPAVQSFAGKSHHQVIDKETTKKIRKLCEEHDVTLFMFLQTAFAVLLSRYSRETDIVMGSAIAGRTHQDVENIIGFFANSVPLRSDLSGNPCFSALLKANRAMILDAYKHQHIPFEMLVENLRPERSLNHNPIFQVSFLLQNSEAASLDIQSLHVAGTGNLRTTQSTRFDLEMAVKEVSGSLSVGWLYSEALFEEETLERWAMNFGILIKSIIQTLSDTRETGINELGMTGVPERHLLLKEWNSAKALYPQEQCIHQLFEAQVGKAPSRVALLYEDQHLTYAELNARSNQLAHYLVAQGVAPDTLVGLCVERSLEMVIGMLGILKAGGAYVPLDPNYPEARLKYMLNDSKMNIVVTQEELLGHIPSAQTSIFCVDSQRNQALLKKCSRENPVIKSCLTPQNLAYVIYTSGSTGQPKGTLIEHGNLTRLWSASTEHFGFSERDIWTLFHSFSFDVSVWEIWGALRKGGRLIVFPYWIARSPEDFYQLLVKECVTVLNQTPSAFKQLMQEESLHENRLKLDYVIFAGEALSFSSLAPWIGKYGTESPQLINMYGITETTVHVTYRRLLPGDIRNTHGASKIGAALSDLQILLLDERQCLVPIGVPGEIYVGGAGVARGYLGQPRYTATRFVELDGIDGRWYRSGDSARYTVNGELEYLGRLDDQVKLRGFRVELGEIETQLSLIPGVEECVVLARTDKGSEQRLVAYVVGTLLVEMQIGDDKLPFEQHHKAYPLEADRFSSYCQAILKHTLPDYMVPRAFVVLAELPLTPNGKVDRKALPVPDMGSFGHTDYVAPCTKTEKLLVDIWAELLSLSPEAIGTRANFFALGGHSLLVVKMITRLRNAGLHTDVRTVFSASSLADLCTAIEAVSPDRATRDDYVPPPNLIPSECQMITPDMLPLVSLSAEEVARVVAAVPGGVANVQDIYPLAPLQEGILFHHMLGGEQDPYITRVLFTLETQAQFDALIAAIQYVVNRHDVLRTAIISEGLSQPVQVVYRRASLQVEPLTLDSDRDVSSQREKLLSMPQALDITRAPLLQLSVATDKASAGKVVLLRQHHIVADHVSLEIFVEEVRAYLNGQKDGLPSPAPYRHFVAHALHQAKTADARGYFKARLGDVTEPTAPFNLLDVHGDGRAINEAHHSLDIDLANAIRDTAKRLQISPATLFHAAWAIVVGACSGRDDVVFGTVLSGRLQGVQGADRMLGMFINTLPIRIRLDGKNVRQLVEETDAALQVLLNYEQASLTVAQQCSGVPGGTPLFSAALNYRHSARKLGGVSSSIDQFPFRLLGGQERNNYPFSLSVNDLGDGFSLDAQIDRAVSAERINAYMEAAITQLMVYLQSTEDLPLSRLSILQEAECHRLNLEWNDTEESYPSDRCIHELFEEKVEQHPNKIAVVCGNEQLTYKALNEKSNRIARYLSSQGVKPDTLVGLCVERSLEMVIGILGVLKAGGAYVPIDPGYPQARIQFMLADSGVKMVLTQSHLAKKLFLTDDRQILCLDAGGNAKGRPDILSTQSTDNISKNKIGLRSHHLAYVIYTSGSTGQPKGVMVEHKGLCNVIVANSATFDVLPTSSFLQSLSLNFDASIWVIGMTLARGASLVVLKNIHASASEISNLVERTKVSHIMLTPSLLSMFEPSRIPSVECVIAGGEACQPYLSEQWSTYAKFYNAYGPTEASVCVAVARLYKGTSVNIGNPIRNMKIYLSNARNQLAPLGVNSEMYIGGVGVARGYLNDTALTAERFVPNPFGDDPTDVLYRTGDVVRWMADGNLEFVARMDDQVKLRGLRIELGEIEYQLMQLKELKEVVVRVHEDKRNEKSLVAYLVPNQAFEERETSERDSGVDIDTQRRTLLDHCKAHLRSKLPDYMVPSVYVVLDRFPLTPNGKIDRNVLPAPGGGNLRSEAYVAPSNVVEEMLCDLWMSLLKVEQVGVHDNFFYLGGNSLLATTLINAIRNECAVELPLADIFEFPTIAKLATRLEKEPHLDKKIELNHKIRSSASAVEEEIT